MAADESTPRKPLRLWPGIAAAALLVLGRYLVPLVVPGSFGLAFTVGLAGTLLILVWWIAFSRAPWAERIGALVVMTLAVIATSRFVHESIAGGMMSLMLPIYAAPILSVALVVWAVASRGLSAGPRRLALVAVVALACGAFTLIRTDGITGDAGSQLAWRWTPTAEAQLIASSDPRAGAEAPASTDPRRRGLHRPGANDDRKPDVGRGFSPGGSPDGAGAEAPASTDHRSTEDKIVSWPGFRGPHRDGVVRGVRIGTDWTTTPPVELWRRAVGPGWSSFAVRGDFIYTQEQRGEEEVVSCYRLSTGEPVWLHRDPVRFWESNGGAGPRATPTVHEGRVYAMGATGMLNALDVDRGTPIWKRDAAKDTERIVPDWGFAGSPLVIDDLVIVALAGGLAAYDAATGDLRWLGPAGGGGYSSPHLATIDGVPQVLLLRGSRTISVAPADGAVLWEDVGPPSVSIVQPAIVDGDVLMAPGEAMGGMGIRRVSVSHRQGVWSVEERWTSRGLKPYFNDFVVHEGHAYGFDGGILSAIDLEDGSRVWKGGRFGHGQLVLLPDQDLLLVLSEEGELALVSATPDRFTEIARVPGIEGKTWNHPVVVGGLLLVRNDREMAAFRLPAAAR